jgi:acyl-CoA thioester hydrolase
MNQKNILEHSSNFKLTLSVRDYECDMQGRVNNAVYMNYFEHARHQYLKTIGIDFKHLIDQGIHLVATRVEIDYKKSLQNGDEIEVTANLQKISQIKYVFNQSIYRKNELIAQGVIYAVGIDTKGKPIKVESLNAACEITKSSTPKR